MSGFELARLAREGLTTARQATLLVADVGETDCEVALLERDGRPQFGCAADSPVATATGRVAELHVPLGRARGGGTVEFAGRLRLVALHDGEAVVELGLTSVLVQCGARGPRCTVPLAAYRDALTFQR